MNSAMRNAKKKKVPARRKVRAYDSALRREQAEQTASRILDALSERLRRGDRELSYATVAKQARVSVPTVYRHFPTRADLFRALVAREEASSTPIHELDPSDLDAPLRSFFRRFDDPDDIVRKGRLSVMWELSRAGTVPRRRAGIEALVDARCPGLPEPERTYLVDTCVVLVSSATGEAFRGYLGLDGDGTADRVLFAIEALLASGAATAKRRKKEAGR
jgi:AcrR family transcriptional regulator